MNTPILRRMALAQIYGGIIGICISIALTVLCLVKLNPLLVASSHALDAFTGEIDQLSKSITTHQQISEDIVKTTASYADLVRQLKKSSGDITDQLPSSRRAVESTSQILGDTASFMEGIANRYVPYPSLTFKIEHMPILGEDNKKKALEFARNLTIAKEALLAQSKIIISSLEASLGKLENACDNSIKLIDGTRMATVAIQSKDVPVTLQHMHRASDELKIASSGIQQVQPWIYALLALACTLSLLYLTNGIILFKSF